nr:protein NRT1/ PTR FAMILY 5.5-like [Coffea arabica]
MGKIGKQKLSSFSCPLFFFSIATESPHHRAASSAPPTSLSSPLFSTVARSLLRCLALPSSLSLVDRILPPAHPRPSARRPLLSASPLRGSLSSSACPDAAARIHEKQPPPLLDATGARRIPHLTLLHSLFLITSKYASVQVNSVSHSVVVNLSLENRNKIKIVREVSPSLFFPRRPAEHIAAGESSKALSFFNFLCLLTVLIWADLLATYVTWIMQKYLTDVWKVGFTHAAGIMNVYTGLTKLVPFILSYLGTLEWITTGYCFSQGLGFLSMSTPPALHKLMHICANYQPNCIGHTQKAIFYTGLALTAVGVSGHNVSLAAFALDQLERSQVVDKTSNRQQSPQPEEDISKLQFQPVEAMMELVKRQNQRNGSSISGLRSLGVIFVLIVAVIALIALPYIHPWKLRFGIPAIFTLAATLLFIQGSCEYQGSRLGFSDRDIIRFRTQSQERRVIICMLPVWITCIICSVVTSVGNTYFVEQASHLNYKVGKLKFPDSTLLLLYEAAKLGFKRVYNCMKVAGETHGIHVIRSDGLIDKPNEKIPMTVFLLVPQFFLLGGLDSFYENSVAEFLNDQSPPSMKKYLVYLNPGLSGLGIMGSVLSVHLVGKISEKGGKKSWFQHDLNESHLNYYYWVLAGLSAANFLWFLLTALIQTSFK